MQGLIVQIQFDIHENFKLHLNDAIESLRLFEEHHENKYYRHAILFTAFSIELAVAIVAQDVLNTDILTKNNKTKKYDELSTILKRDFSNIIKNSFSGLDSWNIGKETPESNIKINIEVLEKSLKSGIIKHRNDLVHYQGCYNLEDINIDLLISWFIIYCIIPENLRFCHSLKQGNINFILENRLFDKNITDFIAEVFIHDNASSSINIDNYDIDECGYCGNNSLTLLSLPAVGIFCPICLYNGYLVACIQCSNFVLPWKASKYDDSGVTHICEYCFDNFRK
jgi:hypothetical protein